MEANVKHFTKEMACKILKDEIDSQTLAKQYPEYKELVIHEFSKINKDSSLNEIIAVINSYKFSASTAVDKIQKSSFNQKSIDAFLPNVIKARIAIDVIEQIHFAVQTGQYSGKVRFSLWEGYILQKLLFKKDLARKPVSLLWFKLLWPFIANKKLLMPLVGQKGIYCFYSQKLVKELAQLIGDTECLEIGAGDGTLTQFLTEQGVTCRATDDYSWSKYIQYPLSVEKLEAKQALNKYKPATVLCSWPPPGNSFEKTIFQEPNVRLYIVIGTNNPAFSGNHEAYQTPQGFIMEYDANLSSLILPPSKDHAVYLFRRKS